VGYAKDPKVEAKGSFARLSKEKDWYGKSRRLRADFFLTFT